jgi:aspartate 1-decarboxylase
MKRLLMKSKIHKAVVTDTNPGRMDSVTVDSGLMEKVNLKEHEKVLIVDNTNGARVETFVTKGERDSGVVSLNGAATHHIKKGDEVIILSFTWTNRVIEPKVILVNNENKFVEFLAGGEGAKHTVKVGDLKGNRY